jgi:flagellar hook-associated protein 1 FlgK
MSSNSLMGLGKQAATAAYAQLQTTGNNIANASTPGYSRQSVQLAASAGSSYSGSGYLGQGVTVTSVTRATNMFLNSQAVAATAAASADGARNAKVGELEQIFVGGNAGLGGAATQIFNAYADLAATPADPSARQAVLGRLQDFASLARSASARIEVLQANVYSDVRGAVATVNSLASQLAVLNVSIASANNSGQQPNDLLDQRDLLIKKLGEQIEVHMVIGPDQTASVFVGSGQNLVQGNSAHALVALADAADPTRVAVGVRISGEVTLLSSEAIGGGQIGGLLKFQETDLADARNRVGQLVTGLASAVNQQQALGLDLQGRPGAALFSFAGPQVLPNVNNAREADGSFVAAPSITVSDASALKASDYRLQGDPANGGQYIVTRLSDGQVFQPVADGEVIDGFALTIGANALVPGDSFVLKPVSVSAGGLTSLMTNPSGLAAANPVTAVAGSANTGNASISAVAIVAAPAGPAYAPVTLSFTDDSGSYQILDVDGNQIDSGSFVAGQPISHDGIAVSLSGLPRAGDSIAIAPTIYPAASNGNALRFDSMAARGLIDGQTVGDAYASAIAEVGVRSQSAALAASNSAIVSAQADASLGGAVGVNLDEEAARLIQYQQAYQAAAKVMQSAQQMFDAILGILR